MEELNETQRLVFLMISRYPQATDREIAEQLGRRRSTVTLARHHLVERKLYHWSLFPSFPALNVSYVGIVLGNYEKERSIDYQTRMDNTKDVLQIPEYVFSLSSQYQGMSMCFSQDLYAIKEPFERWSALFQRMDPSLRIEKKYFPRKMVEVYKFMDHSAILSQILGVQAPVIQDKKVSGKKRQLRAREKALLLAWMQNPSATNDELSALLHISRTAAGSIRRSLNERGYVQHVIVPAWEKLGMTLGLCVSFSVNPEKKAALLHLRDLPENVFFVASAYEGVAFFVFKDYNHYHGTLQPLLAKGRQELLFFHHPETLFFPLQETRCTLNAARFLGEVL